MYPSIIPNIGMLWLGLLYLASVRLRIDEVEKRAVEEVLDQEILTLILEQVVWAGCVRLLLLRSGLPFAETFTPGHDINRHVNR